MGDIQGLSWDGESTNLIISSFENQYNFSTYNAMIKKS